MNCKDFRDIADTYLSNELLIETNHGVLRHLESCGDCRGLLGYRRELRVRLMNSVKNSPVSRIDPAFSHRLRSHLRNQAFRPVRSMPSFRFAFAGVAAVLMIAAMSVAVFRPGFSDVKNATISRPIPMPTGSLGLGNDIKPVLAVLNEVSEAAIDDHKNCALTYNLEEEPIPLSEAARKFDKVNEGFDTAVMKPLRETFGTDAKFVMSHYCLIHGRYFTHVVLEYKERTVSVLLTKVTDKDVADSAPAMCDSAEPLRSACFSSSGYGIFVVSDLPESDNLLFAKTIYAAVLRHASTKGKFSV